jgi:choline dehydrogenase-like flavoprotein
LRLIKKNNWFYKTEEVVLHVNLEQNPNFNNKLFIINEGENKYTKIKRSVLIWKIKRKEIETLRFFLNIFNKSWQNAGLDKIAELKINNHNYKSLLRSLKVFLHPTGSIRIGTNKSNSVVNKNLKVWNTKNLYVCSTAVFPSSGSTNTGMTLLALAARLGDYLIKKY